MAEPTKTHSAAARKDSSSVLWTGLIQHYVDGYVLPWKSDRRIYAAFNAVRLDLAHPWTIQELAASANVSSEHFRRLCVKLHGRAPMQQVTFLRVQHATTMLTSTEEKIDFIAEQVGYQNAFAFSNMFKKITGFRPSALRHKHVSMRKAKSADDRDLPAID